MEDYIKDIPESKSPSRSFCHYATYSSPSKIVKNPHVLHASFVRGAVLSSFHVLIHSQP